MSARTIVILMEETVQPATRTPKPYAELQALTDDEVHRRYKVLDDESAYIYLYNKYHNRLIFFIRSSWPTRQDVQNDAEDIFHEAFMETIVKSPFSLIGRIEQITALRAAACNAEVFKAALETYGFLLAKCDRRGLVLVDPETNVFSLSRSVRDLRSEELNAFMSPIDAANLPTVEEAKALQTNWRMEAKEQSQSWVLLGELPSDKRAFPRALYGTARTRAIDYWRRQRRYVTEDEVDQAEGGVSDPPAVAQSDVEAYLREDDPMFLAAMEDCMSRLTPEQNQVLLLKVYEPMNEEEIAEILGSTRAAVSMSYFRAWQSLKRCLEIKGILKKMIEVKRV